MRGGVTVRAQDLQTRLPEDVFREIREMHPLLTPKLNNITLRHAVKEYLGNIKAKLYLISKYGDISQWDVSNVTNMSSLFHVSGADSFNQPLNKWNVSKVTNMSEMFNSAISFNQPLNKWNVSKVTDMGGMFYGANSFNAAQQLQLPFTSH